VWGAFTGAIWDGERMRSGTCKTFGKAGWYWADDGTSLNYDGSFTMHACGGDLAGAHAQFGYDWDEEEVAIITGRAFFSGRPQLCRTERMVLAEVPVTRSMRFEEVCGRSGRRLEGRSIQEVTGTEARQYCFRTTGR
jgi:hypothetical protein